MIYLKIKGQEVEKDVFFYRPPAAQGITWTDMGAFVLASCLAFPFLKSGFKVSRPEGGILLALYVVYMILLWPN